MDEDPPQIAEQAGNQSYGMNNMSLISANMARPVFSEIEQNQPVIEVSGLTRSFGKVNALRGLDMHVSRGSITGFVGNNGAGKTTTIHLLLGFIPPNGGNMRVLCGDPRKHALKIRKRVGFFPERDQPYDWMKVDTLFDLGAAAYSTWDRAVQEKLCRQFDIDVQKKIKELSKGMVAKTKLIFALAHCPELLILDEPTSGLDPASRHELMQMIRQLTAEQGVTTLFSSHNLADVSDIASDLLIIHEGRSIYAERMSTIKNELSLIEAANWTDGPPTVVQQSLIKGVQHEGHSYWLVRDGSASGIDEFVNQNDERFCEHRLSLAGVFLFLTRGWIELGNTRIKDI